MLTGLKRQGSIHHIAGMQKGLLQRLISMNGILKVMYDKIICNPKLPVTGKGAGGNSRILFKCGRGGNDFEGTAGRIQALGRAVPVWMIQSRNIR